LILDLKRPKVKKLLYELQLQKAMHTIFRIEKIAKKKVDELLVK